MIFVSVIVRQGCGILLDNVSNPAIFICYRSTCAFIELVEMRKILIVMMTFNRSNIELSTKHKEVDKCKYLLILYEFLKVIKLTA